MTILWNYRSLTCLMKSYWFFFFWDFRHRLSATGILVGIGMSLKDFKKADSCHCDKIGIPYLCVCKSDTHTLIYMDIYKYGDIYIHTPVYMCLYVYIHKNVYIHVKYINIHIETHAHKYRHFHVCIYIFACMYGCVHVV